MGFQKPKAARPHEPSGFTPRSSGRASQRARQQGWQTNEEERTKEAAGKLPRDGGTDDDYGARDFGDRPEDTRSAQLPAPGKTNESTKHRKKASASERKKAA